MIRQLIREMLSEDLAGFVDRTKDIDYSSSIDDPTFDAEWQKGLSNKSMAKDVKRAWAAEADHEFMKSLIKVHWINYMMKNWEGNFEKFMTLRGNNEVSAMGYLPGSNDVSGRWGHLGILIQGRVTLAANNMDDVMSGYFKGGFEKVASKYASSGVPRRPTIFKSKNAYSYQGNKKYILDAESFDLRSSRENELIVDNWKVLGIVIGEDKDTFLKDVNSAIRYKFNNEWPKYANLMLKYNLPIYDEAMTQIDRASIEEALRPPPPPPKKANRRKTK